MDAGSRLGAASCASGPLVNLHVGDQQNVYRRRSNVVALNNVTRHRGARWTTETGPRGSSPPAAGGARDGDQAGVPFGLARPMKMTIPSPPGFPPFGSKSVPKRGFQLFTAQMFPAASMVTLVMRISGSRHSVSSL